MPVDHRRRCALAAAALLVGMPSASGPAMAETNDLRSLCLNPPVLSPGIPGDTLINDQRSINCFAWQSFIALNWPVSGGSPTGFGRPGDLSAVAWQAFVDIPNLRAQLADTRPAEPPPATARPPVPETCPDHQTALTLRQISKFSFPFGVEQALPRTGPAWIADRDGNPVLYQILINEQQYDYISQNGFIGSDTQYPQLGLGTHVDMPRGVLGGDIGSIEIKAAWLVLPEGAEEDPAWRDRYKLAHARIFDEGDGDCGIRTVALVGLHIVRKTTSNPQWIWSTFEHADNAPDRAAIAETTASGDRFRFWSDGCTERAVPQACRTVTAGSCRPQSSPPVTTSCAANAEPAYCLDLFNEACPPHPTQIVRETPIADSGDNLVQQTNAAVQAMIRAEAGQDSVWAHYQLVGTLWSGSPVDENLPGSAPALQPLSAAGMRPNVNALPLANTTMETFFQASTCLACHREAGITETGVPDAKPFAGDYSFVLKSIGIRGMTDQEATDRP